MLPEEWWWVDQPNRISLWMEASGRSWQMVWFPRGSVKVNVSRDRISLCTDDVKVETMQNVWNF